MYLITIGLGLVNVFIAAPLFATYETVKGWISPNLVCLFSKKAVGLSFLLVLLMSTTRT